LLPKKHHLPGEPCTDEPPDELVKLADTIQHPLVKRTGITCTEKGEWALYVTVPKKQQVPLADLEAKCKGFPVVYEAEPDKPLRPH
jgi:hypothetical protein